MQGQDTQKDRLLETFQDLLGQYRPAFGQQRVFERATSLIYGSLFAFARKTMTQLISSLGQTQQDWSANYRLLSHNRFHEEALANITLPQTLAHVPQDQPYQAVIDATPVMRSSRTMPGTGWGRAPGTAHWDRGLARQQRFENISWLVPIQDGYSRALPLRWIHAPTENCVASADAPCREWEAGLRGITWLREQLDANDRDQQTLLVGADGSYDVNKVWRALPHNTVLVCRCAKNRKLFRLPEPAAPHTKGARRKYGERVGTPQEMRQEQAAWTTIELPVRAKQMTIKCRVCGPYLVEGSPNAPLMLLLVKGYHYKGARKKVHREPCQYLVNAVQVDGKWRLPVGLLTLIALTWHRWEIEVCHRQIKTGFGLGEMQCWSQQGSITSVQFMAWGYSVLMLAAYKAWDGLLVHGGQGPPARWQRGSRRWSFSTLLQSYRKQLWDLGDFQPVCPVIGSKGHKNHSLPARSGNLPASLCNAAVLASRG